MILSSTRRWPLLSLVCLAFSACGSPPVAPKPEIAESAILQGQSIDLLRSPELDRIAELQEQRSTGDGRLLTFAESGNPLVRRRAVIALGRLPFPEHGAEVTAMLCRKLSDPEVRVQAAFALGLRQDPEAGGVLQTYFNDADPLLRAAVVAAASRFESPALHLELMIALRDADLNVRIQAALGSALWDTSEKRAADIDRALVDTLRPYKVIPGHTTRTAVEAELVWRTLYALGRRKAKLGRGPFLQYGDSDIPLERLFALRGIGTLAPDQAAIDVAYRALSGPTKSKDWRVAHAACAALGKFADPRSLPGLQMAAKHPSFHVRAEAMRGLGGAGDEKNTKLLLALVKKGLADISVSVRSAALSASVKTAGEQANLRRIDRDLADDNPLVRLGAAEALGLFTSGIQIARLTRLIQDPDHLLGNRALELLGSFKRPELRSMLQEQLKSNQDTGMRLAALGALAEYPDSSDVPFLIDAFRGPQDDISDELAYRVIECLGALKAAPLAKEFVQGALVDKRPFVRKTAIRVLAEDFGLEMGVTHVPPRAGLELLPLAGRDFPLWRHNPLVEMVTSKGSMLFELFAAEAPLHVVNFVKLAEKGTYNGLRFHRVVSNFVAQGGDYRGDGNGGRTWTGQSLGHEIGPRRYSTGSLGMPRNANLDSGGGQFFITHLPTPHLDGRYTIFGELRTGRAVLDSIELGDRILKIRVIDN